MGGIFPLLRAPGLLLISRAGNSRRTMAVPGSSEAEPPGSPFLPSGHHFGARAVEPCSAPGDTEDTQAFEVSGRGRQGVGRAGATAGELWPPLWKPSARRRG